MGLVAVYKRWTALKRAEMELRSLAIGINSSVDLTDDRHLIMLDYDIGDLELVKDSLREAQAFWCLGDAEIFRTKHGYHVFFWYDHVPFTRLRMIIDYARRVDPMYRFITRYYDHKTVRVAGKYADPDIHPVCILPGCRNPTGHEQELGMMKRGEYAEMRKMWFSVGKP